MKKVFDIGDSVVCDMCNKDYTASNAVGGFLLVSHAVCPECAPRMMDAVKREGEEEFITARAMEGETFREFCLRMRGGNNTIVVQTLKIK